MRAGLTGWILAVGLLAACGGGGTTSPVARCGDGRLAAGEACDDGNATSGDGCSACAVDVGYTCAGMPSVCAAFAWDVAVWDQGIWQ